VKITPRLWHWRDLLLECEEKMIYCVIPPELADDLFDKLSEYYKDNPNVKVIIDRRDGKKASAKSSEPSKDSERRRTRIPGTFPGIDVPR
jgi:hypothetical protein